MLRRGCLAAVVVLAGCGPGSLGGTDPGPGSVSLDGIVGGHLAAGETHSCALDSAGTVVCWGSNDSGEATPPAGFFVQLAAGTHQTCGVRSDGTIACWGYGYGAAATHESFAAPWGTFIQVSLSRKVGEDQHACAVRTSGEIACWQECSEGHCQPPSGPFK